MTTFGWLLLAFSFLSGLLAGMLFERNLDEARRRRRAEEDKFVGRVPPKPAPPGPLKEPSQ